MFHLNGQIGLIGWNTRYGSDARRLEKFVLGIEGKRLTYRQVSKPLSFVEDTSPFEHCPQ